jgi:hypothetical protein
MNSGLHLSQEDLLLHLLTNNKELKNWSKVIKDLVEARVNHLKHMHPLQMDLQAGLENLHSKQKQSQSIQIFKTNVFNRFLLKNQEK